MRNPDKTKALKALEHTPVALLFSEEHFEKDELLDFFRNKVAEPKIKKNYVQEFIEMDCLKLIGHDMDEIAFIGKYGSNPARKYAVMFDLS